MLKLASENHNALIFIPNNYRPLPATELYSVALKMGYTQPGNLEGWQEVEVEGNRLYPWYTKQTEKMINMMQITSYFIDNKITKVETGNTIKFKLLRIVSKIYAPFARFRLRHGITFLLFEYTLFNWYTSKFRNVAVRNK